MSVLDLVLKRQERMTRLFTFKLRKLEYEDEIVALIMKLKDFKKRKNDITYIT